MLGAVILVVAMVLVLPVALFAAGAIWSAVVGRALDLDRRPPAGGVSDG
jgi:hypothetical protein